MSGCPDRIFLMHLREIVLRNVEQHGDGLQLRDHGQAVGVVGMDHVAFIDHTQTDAPADGGGDAAVGQLQLGSVDLGLIALDRALGLVDVAIWVSSCCLEIIVAREQDFEAFEIALGVLELGPGLWPFALLPGRAAPETDAGRSRPTARPCGRFALPGTPL